MGALAATPDLPPLPAPPAWLAGEAWGLEPPPTDELRHVMLDEAGILLDRLLVRVARGHGALDVAEREPHGRMSSRRNPACSKPESRVATSRMLRSDATSIAWQSVRLQVLSA